MYNDKNRQIPVGQFHGRQTRMPIGHSRPTFATTDTETGDIPRLDERMGNRLCDGSLPETDGRDGCAVTGGWGLHAHPLAMVYSPLQEFHELYSPEKALERGTLFAELDLPFEGENGKKGGCLC